MEMEQSNDKPHGSGSFIGHVIPAAFFFAYGAFILGLILKRSRSLPPGVTYCEMHVPERNATLLWRMGIVLVVLTLCGVVVEAIGGILAGLGVAHQLGHESFYFCYTFVGLVLVLESFGKLPPDSGRKALCLAFFLQYLGWTEHGLMKSDMADQRIHLLQAQISLCTTLAVGYSVYNPKSIEAFVLSFAFFILVATWLFTAGCNAEFVNISRHLVGPYLSLQVLAIALVITICAAFFSGSQLEQNAQSAGKYSIVDAEDEPLRENDLM
mmetsp:Transcript_11188/g.17298  ORF Transcript_11188/g.17298 Transcript_11188/m.17298 type:complete len:268 (+) Transcript_11188:110-913(+)